MAPIDRSILFPEKLGRLGAIKCFLGFVVASAGMVSELALAYLYSAVFGGTVLQYVITVGLFTFSMGLGVFCFPPSRQNPENIFQNVQWILFLLTLISGTALSYLALHPPLASIFGYGLYLPAILIGLFSGVELPLLMEKEPERTASFILGSDYLGMFSATLLFPLVILPLAGVPLAFAFSLSLHLLCIFLARLFWDKS